MTYLTTIVFLGRPGTSNEEGLRWDCAFLVPGLRLLRIEIELRHGVGEIARTVGPHGVGVTVRLAQEVRVYATHVHPSPVFVRVHRRIQLSHRTPIQGNPKPPNPDHHTTVYIS